MLTIVQYFYIYFIQLLVIPCYCITRATLFKLYYKAYPVKNPLLTEIENIPLGR